MALTGLTYDDVGCTRPGSPPPAGYHRHAREAVLGGEEVWEAARQALWQWRMFDMPWVRLHVGGPPAVGSIATVETGLGPLRLRNACRVLAIYDSAAHCGFSYGTLPGHAMSGEERFSVWRDAGEVRYEILAYARPGTLLARLGLPVVRRLQWKFGTDSLAAMHAAVRL